MRGIANTNSGFLPGFLPTSYGHGAELHGWPGIPTLRNTNVSATNPGTATGKKGTGSSSFFGTGTEELPAEDIDTSRRLDESQA